MRLIPTRAFLSRATMALYQPPEASKLIFAPAGSEAHGQAEQFTRGKLTRSDLDASSPIRQFHAWFSHAQTSKQVAHPESCALSTASLPSGRVSSRMVYLKELDAQGFVVYTNLGTSRKAADVDSNGHASLLFFWEALQRQVRVEGTTARLTRDESQAYFDTRVRGSRIGAWASRQSQVLRPDPAVEGDDGRAQLERWVGEVEERFRGVEQIPVPDFWGGLRIVPTRLEFWQGRESRLHDRFVYEWEEGANGEAGKWTLERLSPARARGRLFGSLLFRQADARLFPRKPEEPVHRTVPPPLVALYRSTSPHTRAESSNMYSGGYGFGNAAPNFNSPGPQQQVGSQPGQQVMYNQQQQQQQQQQFAGMNPQGGFNPGANPQMMQAGASGIMPNTGMPGMPANGQMPNYQQHFGAAQYGQVLPSSVNAQNFSPNNYMMNAGMQGFPMNQAMPQQHQMMQQRMQPQQMAHAMGQATTPQRPPSTSQSTPSNSAPPQQPQFSTPQTPVQAQTPTAMQPTSAGAATPQTPTFPINQGITHGNETAPTATPLSPGTEAQEKKRFSTLLDINHELLYESIQIQVTQQELKKEHAADGSTGERKPTEEENLFQQDYLQCMRRIQTNLTYLAALADRKSEVKVPPYPAYLSAPPLNLSLRLRVPSVGPDGSEQNIDPQADRVQRDQSIKDLYQKLQSLFPGIDPKKEPLYGKSWAQQKSQQMSQASPTTQKTPQLSSMPAPPMNQNPMGQVQTGQGQMGQPQIGQGQMGHGQMPQGQMGQQQQQHQHQQQQMGQQQQQQQLGQPQMNQGQMGQGQMNQGHMGQAHMNQPQMNLGQMTPGQMGQFMMAQNAMGHPSMGQNLMNQNLNQG
ncbi:hypothetical protein S40288_05455 [Stachybotrys chartarum IBT 40288]|nr:hypothetical protein S40288_05455 [Stachybotrys chartarum IBT 40288]